MDYQVVLKYFTAFFAAFAVTAALTPLVRGLAARYGLVDQPDERRIHRRPVPRLGGVAVFLGFHAGAALIFLLPWREFTGQLNSNWWWKFLAISAWLLAVGIADDVRGIRPWVKLSGQIIAALLAFFAKMRFGVALGFPLPIWLDLCCTLVWILAITNAFNLIDGMDGLATGLAIIGAIGMAGSLLLRHVPADVLVLISLAGACAAFLLYNFHPASIFLGDSGSMFLGFSLACIALSTASKGTAMASLGVPLLAVGVPLFDTLLAVWRRSVRRLFLATGQSSAVMQADLEHLHHRLSKAGMSQRKVATALYALAFLLVALALLGLIYKTHALGIYLLAFVAGTYLVVKHLARVELWDSGTALLAGLRRPSRKVVAVLVCPLLDVFLLSAVLFAALWLCRPELAFLELKYTFVNYWPGWVGGGFLFLFFGRAYQRVWSRARVSELMQLELAFGLSVVTALALTVFERRGFSRDELLLALVYGGLGLPLVMAVRLFPRLLQDALVLSARHPSLARNHNAHNTLIYGAGISGILFLRKRSACYPEHDDSRRIVGFLDDDHNLHGRLVYGYRVCGGGERLEQIVQDLNVREVIVAAGLTPAALANLHAVARRRNLLLTEWHIEERPLAATAEAAACFVDEGA